MARKETIEEQMLIDLYEYEMLPSWLKEMNEE
jgi:hypothetical protein